MSLDTYSAKTCRIVDGKLTCVVKGNKDLFSDKSPAVEKAQQKLDKLRDEVEQMGRSREEQAAYELQKIRVTAAEKEASGYETRLRMLEGGDAFGSGLFGTARTLLRAAAEAQNSATPTVDAQVKASVLTAFVVGRLQRFTRSGFKRLPSEHLEASFAQLL